MKKRGDFLFFKREPKKKAQLTVFIIIAILIVGGILGYFLIKNGLSEREIPEDFREVYNYYEGCSKASLEEGAKILGARAGYINAPSFIPGSEYAPFSNQLEFLGIGVPYWYYLSSNGLVKEQIPSKSSMENQLGNYIEERIIDCNL